jgi:hypothetical protein
MNSAESYRLHAHEPLRYALAAQELLDNHDQFEEHQEWVLYWVAGVALLRSVGHVLDKVDSARCPTLKQIISKKWTSWNTDRAQNEIFWDFIEKERNNVLKVFELGVHGVDQMPIVLCGGTSASEDDSVYFIDYLHHDETGEDGRDLFHEAVNWWQQQLQAIETEWHLALSA